LIPPGCRHGADLRKKPDTISGDTRIPGVCGAAEISAANIRLADLHTLPEGDPVPDPGRRGLGVGIIPGGVDILGAARRQRVIMGNALPRADRGRIARTEQRGVDRVAREIMIALATTVSSLSAIVAPFQTAFTIPAS
jgi:hypothetical protein